MAPGDVVCPPPMLQSTPALCKCYVEGALSRSSRYILYTHVDVRTQQCKLQPQRTLLPSSSGELGLNYGRSAEGGPAGRWQCGYGYLTGTGGRCSAAAALTAARASAARRHAARIANREPDY